MVLLDDTHLASSRPTLREGPAEALRPPMEAPAFSAPTVTKYQELGGLSNLHARFIGLEAGSLSQSAARLGSGEALFLAGTRWRETALPLFLFLCGH